MEGVITIAIPTSKVWIKSQERRLEELPVSDLNSKAALRVISKVHHVTESSNIFEMHNIIVQFWRIFKGYIRERETCLLIVDGDTILIIDFGTQQTVHLI